MSAILDAIRTPSDLKELSSDRLLALCGEIRELIVETVSHNGGHLAGNLGTVELTLALLRAFDVPRDKILFDVGHQSYTYKILTDRRDRFHTLRQTGGLSGFPLRTESAFDIFGAGHAGTALSAAMGVSVSRDRRGGSEHVIAVVGDGALGNGISFEALNNMRTAKRLIVILNDNEMSIAANVGSISRHLGGLLANPRYNRWKGDMEKVVSRYLVGARHRSLYYRIEESIKSLFLRSGLFEEFGLRYIGPIDGHDLGLLDKALMIAREYPRPILLHVVTQKGRGFKQAEDNPESWHGTPPFDRATGARKKNEFPSYSEVFGRTLERLAGQDPRIMAITAAMPTGTGLTGFAKRFPDRFFDVGIAEGHAMVFAAGLAAGGCRPFLPIYSTFSQRAVDCLIHDIGLQRLPVVVGLDRAGIVGDDGPTHHGVFDIPLLSGVPNLVLAQPGNEAELAAMMEAALRRNGPTVIRYPRGAGPGVSFDGPFEPMPEGRADILVEGEAVQLWALGDMIPIALEAARLLGEAGVPAGVVNARFIKPLDEVLLAEQAGKARVMAVLENGMITGGFGSLVEAALVRRAYSGRILRFGWPDEFIPHGEQAVLFERYGLTARAIALRIRDVWEQAAR
jgi:1-deoxy-D-xylulose-5-phosphate synthase